MCLDFEVIGYDGFELVEDGVIFVENVLFKVRVVVVYIGFVVFVDDLGICVDVFGGFFGVFLVYWVG